MSTQEAMAEGKLIVEFKTQQKIREENTSYGIITVKTTTETRPYTILGAIDPNTEEEVSTEVAYSRGTRITYFQHTTSSVVCWSLKSHRQLMLYVGSPAVIGGEQLQMSVLAVFHKWDTLVEPATYRKPSG